MKETQGPSDFSTGVENLRDDGPMNFAVRTYAAFFGSFGVETFGCFGFT